MNNTALNGVQRWQKRFKEDPLNALDAALIDRVSFGQYDVPRTIHAVY